MNRDGFSTRNSSEMLELLMIIQFSVYNPNSNGSSIQNSSKILELLHENTFSDLKRLCQCTRKLHIISNQQK